MNQLYAEVVRHHDHLANWLSGEATPDDLDRFHQAHHPDFILIAVDGTRTDLPTLMNALSTSHNAVPGLKIDIEQFEEVAHTPDLAVCRFLERHSVGGLRRVTAVLTGDLRWLAVQETPVL
ncbi:hypothetical protein [Kribbella shirazensis]|uniref:DUF4440 domain-containing protein n=1 Tax=Kribbella shirazensis TaxID=1105143 RepID=A0A7X5VFN8_9ACTN|nr:hypothetical protein [Kribbella shirazensis]NIK60194.1 hypothetical protein [Kribbella shirazensis]